MITRVTYKPIKTATWKGLLGYFIYLDESLSDITEIAAVTENIKAHNGKKVITFIESENTSFDEQSMMTLTKTLKDHGYLLRVVTYGYVYHQWYVNLNWITVKISDKPWAMFDVNDVILYYIPGMPEPKLPVVEKGVKLYISDALVNEDQKHLLISFIHQSKYNWLIEFSNLETSIEPVNIYPAEEEEKQTGGKTPTNTGGPS
jgi:hypothetical protein